MDVFGRGPRRALTLRTLRQRHLLDARAVAAGRRLHLTLVLVSPPVRPAHRLPVVAAVSVAGAVLVALLLQAAEHVVALVPRHEAWRRGGKGV